MNENFIYRLLERTNLYRSQFGLAPLTLNAQLTAAARKHSQDMALNDFIGHQSSDGSSTDQRFKRDGYQYSFAGENVGWGYSTPEEVVDAWFNETPPNDGHRQNILNPNYKEIGIGYYLLKNDTGSQNWHHYWTQDFGSPLNGQVNPVPAPNPTPTFTGAAVHLRTEGSDQFTGTPGSDIILGLGGNDTVSGGAGDDFVSGNAGSDSVSGDAGSDVAVGGQGDDTVIGGAGNDIMVNGNKGNDRVFGGDGDDTVYGGAGNDSLLGDAGDDWLSGDLGADTLIGGAGSDVYFLGGDATDIFYYSDAEDLIGLTAGLSFQQLGFSQGASGAQIINLTTNSVLAVLPGVDVSLLDGGDFISI
jgi:Ca2+-binding RTX toxin-like protein